MQVVVHLFPVGLDADGAVLIKGNNRLGKEPCRLEEVVDADRHEDVQLEIALGSRHPDGDVVAHDLDGDHRDRLALGGVDLAGHDRGAGLVFGDEDFAEAVSGAGSQPADVVCDLHHIRRQRFEGAVGEDNLIFRGQRVELVGRGDELLAGQFRNRLSDLDVKALRGVEAGADGGAAQRQFLQFRQGDFQHLAVLLKGGAPAADFLGKLDGGRVLEVGAAALDDALVFRFQPLKGLNQRIDGREDLVLDGQHRRDVHRGGEGVVGGLGHVDVVVGVQQLFAGDLIAAVGDDLVGVHVRLGAAAGLPDDEGEVVIQLPADDLVAGGGNGSQLLVGHLFGF